MATNKYQITQKQSDGTLLVLHPETSADIVKETDNLKFMTPAEKTKLNGIQDNAQVNVIEKVSVNGVALTPTNKGVNITIDTTDKIPLSQKGKANGVAELGTDGKVPSSQLPSYVDDVVEYANKAGFPGTGEAGKIYVAKDTNKVYRWSGTEYVEISASLALGETSSTAYAGNKGKANADAISALQTRMSGVETVNTNQATDLTNIKNGTTKVGKATVAESCTGNSATATKLATGRKFTFSGDMIGVSPSFDGSASIDIRVALSTVGTSGTYSVVTTDTTGRVTAGGMLIEVGTSTTSSPSSGLAVGGIFYKML